MKRLTLLLLFAAFLVIPQFASAQTKKLLVFKKGVAVVSGTVKGSQPKVYYFKVKKDTDMEIFVDEADKQANFTLFKPNGEPFYADGEINSGRIIDMMDILPDAGIYKIVVKLPEDLQVEKQPIKFTLRLILK